MNSQLLATAQQLGLPLDEGNLADILWMAALVVTPLPAASMESDAFERGSITPRGKAEPKVVEDLLDEKTGDQMTTPDAEKSGQAQVQRSRSKPGGTPGDGTSLYSGPPQGGSSGHVSATPFRVPSADALPGALAIGRSLRPLRHQAKQTGESVLDEEKTAERSAEAGVPYPILRPSTSRWLEADVVYEAASAMAVWRELADEIGYLIERHGAFGRVRRFSLGENGAIYRGIGPGALKGKGRPASELRDPRGRRVVFIVSTVSGSVWRDGTIAEILRLLAKSNPVAIINPLPTNLWNRTRLWNSAAHAGGLRWLSAARPSLPNEFLTACVENPDATIFDEEEPTFLRVKGLTVPVLSLNSKAIGRYARLVAGGTSFVPGVPVDRFAPDPFATKAPIDDPTKTFECFISSASPEAIRLAHFLASVPLTPPVMRIVHRACIARPTVAALAEFLTSPLVTPTEFDGEFHMDPELRRRFLLASPLAHTALADRAISAYIENRLGISGGFLALAGLQEGGERVTDETRRFAEIARTVRAIRPTPSQHPKYRVALRRDIWLPDMILTVAKESLDQIDDVKRTEGNWDSPDLTVFLLGLPLPRKEGGAAILSNLARFPSSRVVLVLVGEVQQNDPLVAELQATEYVRFYKHPDELPALLMGAVHAAQEGVLDDFAPKSSESAPHPEPAVPDASKVKPGWSTIMDQHSVARLEYSDGSQMGTAFIIADGGLFVTCLHAVEHKPGHEFAIRYAGKTAIRARVLALDAATDLAILQADASSSHAQVIPSLRGEDSTLPIPAPVLVYGYSDDFSPHLKIESGRIIELAPDRDQYILSGSVAKGASGAAVVYEGEVVGLVHSILSDARTAVIPVAHLRRLMQQAGLASSTGEAPEHTGPPGPARRLRVLVIGRGGRMLTGAPALTATALGRALARTGHSLISGGWTGVDHIVSREFINTLREVEEPVDERLTHVMVVNSEPDIWRRSEFKNAGHLESVATSTGAFLHSVEMADAVVLIGGWGATYQGYELAKSVGRPVWPMGGTFGDARRVYEEIAAEKRRVFAGLPIAREMEARMNWQFLGMPITKEADAKDAVDACMQLLISSATIPSTINSSFSTSSLDRVEPSRFSMRLLWVDDNPSNNYSLVRQLDGLRVESITARDTAEGLQALASSSLDVVITDMGRPSGRRAGYELLRQMKSQGYTQPVIIYAGSDRFDHHRQAVERGAYGSTNQGSQVMKWIDELRQQRGSEPIAGAPICVVRVRIYSGGLEKIATGFILGDQLYVARFPNSGLISFRFETTSDPGFHWTKSSEQSDSGISVPLEHPFPHEAPEIAKSLPTEDSEVIVWRWPAGNKTPVRTPAIYSPSLRTLSPNLPLSEAIGAPVFDHQGCLLGYATQEAPYSTTPWLLQTLPKEQSESLGARAQADPAEQSGLGESEQPRRADLLRTDPPISKLLAQPEILLFHPQRLDREIHLLNQGEAIVTFTTSWQGNGFSLGDPSYMGNIRLDPGEEICLRVKSQPVAANSALLLSVEGGDSISIPCRTDGPVAPRVIPARVVSIDIGAGYTSVFCADPTTGQVDALPLSRNGNVRVETILRVRADRGAWEALTEIDLADYEGVIRGLKSVVREKEDTVDVEGVGTIRVHDLLTFYLRSLLIKKIDPYLRNAVEPGGWVEFIFTVPVLDGEGGAERSRYEERLRRAARSAGFEDPEQGWTVVVIPEPDGGLWDVLTNENSSKSFRSGERVLVMDCGAGTTDLTLARIQVNGRTPTLTDYRNSSAESGVDQQIHFGGDIVTYNLGLRWITDLIGAEMSGERDEHQRNVLKDGLLERLRGVYGREQWQLSNRPGAENYETYFDRMLKHEEPSHMDVRCWFFRYFRLFDYLEAAKRQMCATDLPYVVFRDFQDTEQHVTRSQLSAAMAEPLRQLIEAIRTFLTTCALEPNDIAHVILLGGSVQLAHLRESLHVLFDERQFRFQPALLDTAIGRGAALSRSLYVRPIPFGVSYKDPEKNVRVLALEGQVLRSPIQHQPNLQNDAFGYHEFTLMAIVMDHSNGGQIERMYILHRFQLFPGSQKIQITISESGVFADHIDASGRVIDPFQYEF